MLSRNALLSALQGAKNVYPNEFIALFRREKEKDELIIPPFSEYGEDYSSFSEWHLPPMNLTGSFHSHPGGKGTPSRQDLRFFSKIGGFHVIAYPPFSLYSFNCFSTKGEKINLVLM